MTKTAAHTLLDRIRAGTSNAPEQVITDALIATGDLPAEEDAAEEDAAAEEWRLT